MATTSFHSGAKRHAQSTANGSSGTWNFEVDYNDHFETPLIAYQELLPALQVLQEELHITDKSSCKIYDPYFCQGRMVEYMRSLGYDNVLNFNRDFYHDVHRKTVPEHDILVTNPPYSGEHKTKLLDFLSKNKAANSQFRPFALLLPVYIATKSYWKAFVETSSAKHGLKAMYILPARYYEYAHPENTGKDIPPFYSAWLLGNLTPGMVAKIEAAYANFQAPATANHNHSSFVAAQQLQLRPLRFSQLTVTTDVQTLIQLGLVTDKRPNPKQRLKQKQQKHQVGTTGDNNVNSLGNNAVHNVTRDEHKKANHQTLKRSFESVRDQSKDTNAVTDQIVNHPPEKPKSTRHSKKKKRLKAILAGDSGSSSNSGVATGEGDVPKKKKRRF